MATSLIAALAPAAISAGAGLLFGGKKGSAQSGLQPGQFSPSGFSGGGLGTTFSGGNVNLTASPERMGFVGNVANTFGELGSELGLLRSKVAPGMSELRASRLAEIDNARSRAIGDLRENLQRRRVLGSSFGADAISRAESEFGGQRAKVAGETFLQELEASNQLVQAEFAARRGQFQTFLDELNLEANLAASLAGKATDTLGANARTLAQLNALEQQNAGKFFGGIGQQLGTGVGSLFKPGGGGGGVGASLGSL